MAAMNKTSAAWKLASMKKGEAQQAAEKRLAGQYARPVVAPTIPLPKSGGGMTAPGAQMKQAQSFTPLPAAPALSPGEYPSTRDVLARIVSIAQEDKTRGDELLGQFYRLQQDKGSPYYNPYTAATNTKAIQALAEYGIDASGGNVDELLREYGWYLNYARTSVGGYAPLAPTKTSSAEENIAYWLQTLLNNEGTTRQAEDEWRALRQELAEYANSPQNYSDEEILSLIDWSKYGTLQRMDKGRDERDPLILNRAVGYSQDALYGAIWAARNGGGTGNEAFDMVNYALGRGALYAPERRPATAAEPVPEAVETPGAEAYNPYLKPKYATNPEWDPEDTTWQRHLVINPETGRPKNPGKDATPEQADAWARYQAAGAMEDTEKAKAELEALRAYIQGRVDNGDDEANILKGVYARLGYTAGISATYPTLAKMEEYRKEGGYLPLTEAVDFTLPALEAMVREQVAARNSAAGAAEVETPAPAGEFTWAERDFDVQQTAADEADAANMRIDFTRGIKDYLAGREVTDDAARAWVDKYGWLLGGAVSFTTGGSGNYTVDSRAKSWTRQGVRYLWQDTGVGEAALKALTDADSEYVTADERIDLVTRISRDLENAEQLGVPLDEYYAARPEALRAIQGLDILAAEREAQDKARQAAEREAWLSSTETAIDDAFTAVANGTANSEQAALAGAVRDYDIESAKRTDDLYRTLLSEASLRAHQTVYGQSAPASSAIMLLAMRPYDDDLRYAAAMGLSLAEFYERKPDRRANIEEAYAQAERTFEEVWSEFGMTLEGMQEAYEQILRENAPEAQEKAPTAVGSGVGVPTVLVEGAKKGWNQFSYGMLNALDFFLLQEEPEDVAAWTRGVLSRDEYRQAVLESLDGTENEEEKAYWLERMESVDDIYKLGYNLSSEAVQQALYRRQQNIRETNDFMYENGTEAEMWWMNATSSVVSNGLAMAGTTALTAMSGGGAAAGIAASATMFGLPEGAELGRELYAGGKSLDAARAWGLGGAVLTGASEYLTNVNFMPSSLSGRSSLFTRWLVDQGAVSLFGKTPGVAAKVANGLLSFGLRGAISSAEEGVQEFIQSNIMQVYEGLAKGQGVIAPDQGKAVEEGLMGLVTGLFLFGQGAVVESAVNAVSGRIGRRLETQGGGLTAQDGLDLMTAYAQDNQNPTVTAANERAAIKARQAKLTAEAVAAGALHEAMNGSEAQAFAKAERELRQAEQAATVAQDTLTRAEEGARAALDAFTRTPADNALLGRYTAALQELEAAQEESGKARAEAETTGIAYEEAGLAFEETRVSVLQTVREEAGKRAASEVNRERAQEGMRQFNAKTAQDSPLLTDELKQTVRESTRATYTPETLDDWLAQGKSRVREMGYEQARQAVLTFEGPATPEQVALANAVIQEAQARGDEQQLALLLTYGEQGTELGKSLAARKIFGRMTPTGAAIYAARTAEQLRTQRLTKMNKAGKAALLQGVERTVQNAVQSRAIAPDVNVLDGETTFDERLQTDITAGQAALIEQYGLTNTSLPGLHYNRATLKQRMLATILTSDGMTFRQLTEQLEQMRRKLPVPTLADTRYIEAQMKRYHEMGGEQGGREAEIALARANEATGNIVQKTARTKREGYRKSGMLLNGRTIVRNILSNVSNMPLEGASRVIGAGLDAMLGAATGERTVKLGSLSDYAKQWKAFTDELGRTVTDHWVDKADTSQGGRYEQTGRRTYQNRLGEFANQLTGFLMQIGDRPFWKRAYFRSLTEQQRIAQTAEITSEMHERAVQDANYTTYQEDNEVAAALQHLKHTAVIGTVIDYVIPFAKVPTNLVKRMYEYSPVGLLGTFVRQGMMEGLRPMGEFDQRKFVLGMARGLTGTGVSALGFLLASAGLVKFGYGDEDDADLGQIKRSQGTPYTIYLDLDDYNIDVSWVSPIIFPLTLGATLTQALEKDEALSDAVLSGLMGAGDMLFEQSFMSSLQSIWSGGTENALVEFGQSVASQNIPAIIRQIASATDPYVRETTSKSAWEAALNSAVLNSLPVLRQTLPAKVDITGEPFRNEGGFVANMLLPFALRTDRHDESLQMLIDLSARTGRTDFLPGDTLYGSRAGITGGARELTDEEKEQFKTDYGTLLMEGGTTTDKTGAPITIIGLDALRESEVFRQADDNAKADMVKAQADAALLGTRQKWLDVLGRTETVEKEYEPKPVGGIPAFFTDNPDLYAMRTLNALFEATGDARYLPTAINTAFTVKDDGESVKYTVPQEQINVLYQYYADELDLLIDTLTLDDPALTEEERAAAVVNMISRAKTRAQKAFWLDYGE